MPPTARPASDSGGGRNQKSFRFLRNFDEFSERYGQEVCIRLGTPEQWSAGSLEDYDLLPVYKPGGADWPPAPALDSLRVFLGTAALDLASSQACVIMTPGERGKHMLVYELLKNLAKLQFASPPDPGGGPSGSASGVLAGGASVVMTSLDELAGRAADGEEGEGGKEGEDIEEGEDGEEGEEGEEDEEGEEGCSGFILFSGTGVPRAAHVADSCSLEAVVRKGCAARLLLEVKPYGLDPWYQPLAWAMELLRLNEAHMPPPPADKEAHPCPPPADNVVWAVLTDLSLWRFFRVELREGGFYVSRCPCLTAPLLSSSSLVPSEDGFAQVVSILHAILYPGLGSETMADRLRSANTELQRMRDAWVEAAMEAFRKQVAEEQEREQEQMAEERERARKQMAEERERAREQMVEELERAPQQMAEERERARKQMVEELKRARQQMAEEREQRVGEQERQVAMELEGRAGGAERQQDGGE
ncbi:hypothetical protein GPECTOR_102g68 [Gonium pectorale]|uniref:Uncharacterized protein n=1 Tax=Gonium pectorale TaxID=33097 RepID=A0A150G0Y9_GONPE|nr:hypothetical protein GPECTOR_102g68 [Gonium pectorale]|eukprot:KXZ43115.1 hypothetical protein GPECTOR_102g68 [Gonium pectorale]